jgi:AraC-like DNA-binding protein
VETICDAAIKRRSEVILNFNSSQRLLRQTPLIAVGMTRCAPTDPHFYGGGPQECPYIGFNRTSVLLAQDGWRPQVSTLNNAAFHNVGSTFRRRAIDEKGHYVDWFAVSPAILDDLSCAILRKPEKRTGHLFEQPFAPTSSSVFLSQRLLFESLQKQLVIEDLAIEEFVIDILYRILLDASEFWGRSTHRPGSDKPIRGRRCNTIVEEAKILLVTEYSRAQGLVNLAAKLGCSPAQLVRAFPLATGFTLHQYLTSFRLRLSLQLLREPRCNIADIALRLGFVSHSHFSSAFRRKFQMTPSNFVRSQSRHLSTSLEQSLG